MIVHTWQVSSVWSWGLYILWGPGGGPGKIGNQGSDDKRPYVYAEGGQERDVVLYIYELSLTAKERAGQREIPQLPVGRSASSPFAASQQAMTRLSPGRAGQGWWDGESKGWFERHEMREEQWLINGEESLMWVSIMQRCCVCENSVGCILMVCALLCICSILN